jgi:pyruvate dehydrogenase E1 component alpha subunit
MTREPLAATELYRSMLLMRRVEEHLDQLVAGPLRGLPLHLSIGQEAVAAAVGAHRHADDVMVSTHRGIGHALAWGADPLQTLAEVAGRRGGFARGLAGHMHLVVPEIGLLGTNGIVAGGLPIAVGAAFGLRREGKQAIAVAFLGDGAANTGACHEAMNMAAAWSVPVFFVLENNGLAEMTYSSGQTGGDLTERAAAYGLATAKVDATDAEAVAAAVGEMYDLVRESGAPAMLECDAFRALGHFAGDAQLYRDADEAKRMDERDPLVGLRATIGEAADEIDTAIAEQVEALFTEVMAMELPTREDLLELGAPA